VLHAFADALVDPPGVEDPLREGAVVVRRGETEDIGVEDQLGPHARAEGVAVDAHDAGEGAAVGIQGGWGIVGLHLEDEAVVVVEADDAGVVHEDGEAEITGGAGAAFGADPFRRPLDVGLEEGVDLGDPAGPVVIGDAAVEDLVLAVLRPGLGQALQLRVGDPGGGGEADPGALRLDGGVAEVIPEDPHLLQGQGEDPLVADGEEGVLADVEVDQLRGGALRAGDTGYVGGDAPDGVPVGPGDHLVAFDELIGEELGGDALCFRAVDGPPEEILPGGVDPEGARSASGNCRRLVCGRSFNGCGRYRAGYINVICISR